MLKITVVTLFAVLVCALPAWGMATCTGAANCRACKTCKYCAHCASGGGTCGVCSAHGDAPDPPVKKHTESKAAPKPLRVSKPAPPAPRVDANPAFEVKKIITGSHKRVAQIRHGLALDADGMPVEDVYQRVKSTRGQGRYRIGDVKTAPSQYVSAMFRHLRDNPIVPFPDDGDRMFSPIAPAFSGTFVEGGHGDVTATSVPMPQGLILEGSRIVVNDGLHFITGDIRNSRGQTVSALTMYINLYNRNGLLIENKEAVIKNLESGQDWGFVVPVTSATASFRIIRVVASP